MPAKVRLVKALVFPIVMYRCESWTIKKAKHQRIDAYELWCWRRLLRVTWTVRRSKKSILKEINPKHPLGGLMLKLKLWYFGHLMWRADSLEKIWLIGKDLGARKDWRQKERGLTEDEMVEWHRWLNGHAFEQILGIMKDREAWHPAVHVVAKNHTGLSSLQQCDLLNDMFCTLYTTHVISIPLLCPLTWLSILKVLFAQLNTLSRSLDVTLLFWTLPAHLCLSSLVWYSNGLPGRVPLSPTLFQGVILTLSKLWR